MFVAEKKAVNLTLPIELIDALDGIAARLKNKQKWMVPSAALLLFMEQTPAVQDAYIRHFRGVEVGMWTTQQLIAGEQRGGPIVDVPARDEHGVAIDGPQPKKARGVGRRGKPARKP